MSWGADGVTVRFRPHGPPALDGVSLAAPAGEVTGVVGGDGAGKTTLLRCLVGAQNPAAGRVRRPPPRRTGYLAAGSGTYPDLSVTENLAFGAHAYGVPPEEARRRSADLLERTGLAPFGDRLAGDLSGGMRQKLGVIRAFLHRPDLLVLDEPTTGVDPVSRSDLWWLLARAAAEGAAVVFSTTYLDEAERAAGLLVLDQGRALATGTPAGIVDAVPGSVVALPGRPGGEEAGRAWRRRGRWRAWRPDPVAGATAPDLHDAVIALSLARAVAP